MKPAKFPFRDHRTQAELETPYRKWFHDRDQVIADMTSDGADRKTIADQVGCSKRTVTIRRREMGIPPAHNPGTWSALEVGLLLALRDEGDSYNKAGAFLGRSKGAVAGKLNRLGETK